ncbi:MAG: hypothetical protein HY721_35040, partial [Planctomycetes bacterium]|nr:hypothetical protein [Planctomycetota bacterium]
MKRPAFAAIALLAALASAAPAPSHAANFVRGDTDGNKVLQITDAIKVFGYLFLGSATPECLDALD